MLIAPVGVRVIRAGTVAVALLGSVTLAWPVVLDGGRLGRWSVGGWTEGYAVFRVHQETQRQRPEGIAALQLTGDVHPKARFFLDTRTTFGGPPEHAEGFGLINLRDVFQNISPAVEIEEAYVDLFLPSLDVRIGKQKVAWGKLDTFQPTDVLNPRRYTDPFVTDREDQKIGIPSVQASYYPPPLGVRGVQDLRATVTWVPFPVPIRFPLEDERWFPASTSVPPTLLIKGSTFGPGLPDLMTRNVLTTANAPPAKQLDQGAVGLRLTALWGRADWALYYYHGPETAPALAFDTTLIAPNPTGFAQCALGATPGPCRLRAEPVLFPIGGRIDLAGADLSLAVRGVTLRVEGAWSSDRFIPRSVNEVLSAANLGRATAGRLPEIAAALASGKRVQVDLGDLFERRDTVEWGAGIDYRVLGWTPVLQLNQTLILDNSTELLVNDVDTRLFLIVRKPFLAERLQTELGVLQGLERGYTTAGVRGTYTITDRLRVRLGYLLIAGSRNTTIGQFHDQDEGYIQVRYAF